MDYLPAIEINTADKPDSAVIWLHGLGASGHDFEPIIPELGLPTEAAVRFIFPHAPEIPVTVNGGISMPAWYDILEMDVERRLDIDQLLTSARRVADLVDRECQRGIDSRRIVVAGFSQGGAVAVHTALTCPRPLAGLLVMSSYFPTAGTIEPATANRHLPIQVMHGEADPVVPEALGRKACESLRQLDYDPGYSTYPMGHEVCRPQITDIARLLGEWLR